MKRLLLAANLLAAVPLAPVPAFAADAPREVTYWVEPCTNPESGCLAADPDLARWAFEAWQQASEGRLRFVPSDRENARLRLVWALPADGRYGETMSILVKGEPGAQVNVRIVNPGGGDRLLRETIVYLTCLHESGHALGLLHTRNFADIMYSFQYGGDIPEYFGRYRRKLSVREDIRKNAGLSDDDRVNLRKALSN